MKHYIRASGLLFNQPLLLAPDMLDLGVRWANQAMNLNIINLAPGGANLGFYDDDEAQDRANLEAERERAALEATGVQVLPVHGFLVSRGAHINACETMTSYEGLRQQLRAAIANPLVERIVLDIDTPGGSAVGAFELAADIRAMSLIKPITGIVNFMAYSGGYLIGAACTELVVSQTSGVGSVGVIASHMERSKQLETAGVKVTTVYAGAHKNDLSPNEPLTDQSIRVLNDLVQESYQLFTGAVSVYRGMSIEAVRATEAGLYRGPAAIAIGFADRLQTPQDAVDDLARAVAQSRMQRQGGRIGLRASAMNIQATL
ncbi:S49 family peptidase [Pseudomonas kurunegalensis]|uniref:S49 family peptidase n=1 Tax=Pseudomonas kurunegalensis TaxID=485880 RepID=UPI00289444AD|nr:S49 family peptidase [Pseudomonas kurunegalensis]MDT3749751.1 S49 family peptidase [Pseudomonas kurunegalensis]